MSLLQNSNAISTGGAYNLESSLRFRSSASAYLNRTPSSAGNRKTWTWSGWVKRGSLGSDITLFGAGTSGTNYAFIGFYGSGLNLLVQEYQGANNMNIQSNAVFRDPSAWYHIVFGYDTTQATASNRVKLYVNGEQVTSFSIATYPSQNFDSLINNNNATQIGERADGYGPFDGYMTEVNFVDGQALTPSDFGEYDDTTGVWKPKQYTGTYGTNGFYLDFSDSTSTTTLGYDQSPNSNNWTTNNISLTAGTTYDLMNDVPTLTDEDTANFATLNPLSSRGVVPTDGNLTDPAFGANQSTTGTIGVSSGKWYFEVKGNSPYWVAGVTTLSTVPYGTSPNSVGAQALAVYSANGYKYNNGSASAYGATYTTNDIMAIALDLDAGTITWYKNNVSQGVAFTGLSGTYFPVLGGPDGWAHGSINFGQRPFKYTPPTGYKKLNTYNLPDSTIVDGSQYFDTALYTGNGTDNSITGLEFSPDFVWMKARSSAYNNNLQDSVRGNYRLLSDSTSAELGGAITSYNSDGILFTGTQNSNNANGTTYVAWLWRGSDSSAVSNTDGTITSTVSANTTSGFSVVTYTGTGSVATVGHGLGIKPSMIIVKNRSSSENWRIYHTSVGATGALAFTTATPTFLSAYWNNTEPTSSVFTVNNASPEVNENGSNHVAYCFADVEGFSKFGSYEGNGSADGPFVYTGFDVKFLLYKNVDATNSWVLYDNVRDPNGNPQSYYLIPNSSGVEGTTPDAIDFLSNGFKIRYANASVNTSGQTHIYMAFASNPFKNSLAQ